MAYDSLIEKLAKNQYERYTKRKWDSATTQDKALWLDGAEYDLRSIDLHNPRQTTRGYAVMPTSLDVEQANAFVGLVAENIRVEKPYRDALQSAYRSLVSALYK